jgi:hypothetical protein
VDEACIIDRILARRSREGSDMHVGIGHDGRMLQ